LSKFNIIWTKYKLNVLFFYTTVRQNFNSLQATKALSHQIPLNQLFNFSADLVLLCFSGKLKFDPIFSIIIIIMGIIKGFKLLLIFSRTVVIFLLFIQKKWLCTNKKSGQKEEFTTDRFET